MRYPITTLAIRPPAISTRLVASTPPFIPLPIVVRGRRRRRRRAGNALRMRWRAIVADRRHRGRIARAGPAGAGFATMPRRPERRPRKAPREDRSRSSNSGSMPCPPASTGSGSMRSISSRVRCGCRCSPRSGRGPVRRCSPWPVSMATSTRGWRRCARCTPRSIRRAWRGRFVAHPGRQPVRLRGAGPDRAAPPRRAQPGAGLPRRPGRVAEPDPGPPPARSGAPQRRPGRSLPRFPQRQRRRGLRAADRLPRSAGCRRRTRAETIARHAGMPRLWRIPDAPRSLQRRNGAARHRHPRHGDDGSRRVRPSGRGGLRRGAAGTCSPTSASARTGRRRSRSPAPPGSTVDVLAPATGFLRPAVRLHDEVAAGPDPRHAGRPLRRTVGDVRSPIGGTIWAARSMPPVRVGELCFVVAG